MITETTKWNTKATSNPGKRIKVRPGEYYYSPDGKHSYHIRLRDYGVWKVSFDNSLMACSLKAAIQNIHRQIEEMNDERNS